MRHRQRDNRWNRHEERPRRDFERQTHNQGRRDKMGEKDDKIFREMRNDSDQAGPSVLCLMETAGTAAAGRRDLGFFFWFWKTYI